jgi:pyruvate dehydrogenase E2 component (dihydrolipoamide acetyltransferase)
MATKIFLPRLGESVEEAVIGRWMKSVGDPIKRGDVIAELETAKTMMELESPVNGVLLAVFPQIGQTVQMGELVAIVGKAGEDWQAEEGSQIAPVEEKTQPAAQPTRKTGQQPIASKDRLRVSPNARRVAKEHNLALSSLKPKLDGGRITAADVLRMALQENDVELGAVPYVQVPLNQVERVTAERMAQSARTIPQFSVSMEIDVKRALKTVEALNEQAKVRVTLTAYLIRAVALALKQHPRINARFAGEMVICYQHANIALAVATPHGLYVPVIQQAEQLSVEEIAKKIKKLAAKCEDRTIALDDLAGGTFTITNLGMKGVRQFTPILDPSQSAILAVGEIYSTLKMKKDGSISSRKKMMLTLACDHRVVDGAGAADFLTTLRAIIESK